MPVPMLESRKSAHRRAAHGWSIRLSTPTRERVLNHRHTETHIDLASRPHLLPGHGHGHGINDEGKYCTVHAVVRVVNLLRARRRWLLMGVLGLLAHAPEKGEAVVPYAHRTARVPWTVVTLGGGIPLSVYLRKFTRLHTGGKPGPCLDKLCCFTFFFVSFVWPASPPARQN